MGSREKQEHFTSSLQELLITFRVFLRILSSSTSFLNAAFGIFLLPPPVKKKGYVILTLHFPSVTKAIVPPRPSCRGPAAVL